MGRPVEWASTEDHMILASYGQKSNAAIAGLLVREGYRRRTADAVRKRYWRLVREKPGDCTVQNDDTEQAILESAWLKRSDVKFQQRMLAEGYRQVTSTIPGTESPKVAGSVSIGSCTSSAGWAT